MVGGFRMADLGCSALFEKLGGNNFRTVGSDGEGNFDQECGRNVGELNEFISHNVLTKWF